jgi:hypothetical protein
VTQLDSRKGEIKRATLSGLAFDAHLSAQLRNNALDNRQTQPVAFNFDMPKPLELDKKLFLFFRFQTGAIVGYPKADKAIRQMGGAYLN